MPRELAHQMLLAPGGDGIEGGSGEVERLQHSSRPGVDLGGTPDTTASGFGKPVASRRRMIWPSARRQRSNNERPLHDARSAPPRGCHTSPDGLQLRGVLSGPVPRRWRKSNAPTSSRSCTWLSAKSWNARSRPLQKLPLARYAATALSEQDLQGQPLREHALARHRQNTWLTVVDMPSGRTAEAERWQ